MSELPNNWAWSTVGAVTEYIQRGKSPKYAETSELPVINQKCIRWNELQLQHLKYIHPEQVSVWDESRYIRVGDILWNSTGTGTVGRAYLVKEADCAPPKVVDSHVTIVRAAQGLEPRYLFNWIKSPAVQNKIEEMCDGTTNQIELSRKAIAETAIPVAPREEQTRIADHLDTLLARIKACNDHLDAIPGLLKRFRQAVLNAATTGALTEDWRATNAQPWRPVLLGDVASDFSYGSAAKSSKAGAVPVLRMGNIQQGELDWTDLVYTSDPKEIEKYQLVPGDVLFNRTNSPELVGKTAVFQGERPAVYAGYLIRVRCSSSLLPDFLNYCLGSKAGRDYCWSVKSDGVSQSNINAKKLAAFPLALPQPDEQEEIIRRVKALFALSTGVEMRYRRMLERAERLTPQVLAKAFRGELVPQDPNDEPASVLLAKLKTGPTSAAVTPARKRSKATGERPKMSNVDQNSVKTMILKLDTDRFSFDELRAHAAGDYESLKTALFALLEEPNPVVRQVFDEDLKAMRLVRVKP
ncbi:MAG: restriction endonuclease subunit S [Burkholderiaceae bacterium]|nr:restriction endonuclease subunit S [Burkholderiaceae bacterium]